MCVCQGTGFGVQGIRVVVQGRLCVCVCVCEGTGYRVYGYTGSSERPGWMTSAAECHQTGRL